VVLALPAAGKASPAGAAPVRRPAACAEPRARAGPCQKAVPAARQAGGDAEGRGRFLRRLPLAQLEDLW